MSHIAANNIDMKLIIVSMSMFSGLRNPNMAITLVCEGVAAIFKMADTNFQCPISWRVI